MAGEKESYDIKYQVNNYFRYKEWIYKYYIQGLVTQSELKSGDTILDAACGQGFFSYLLRNCGLKVYSNDISIGSIRSAKSAYDSLGIHFLVSDILSDPFAIKFDCVFTRSCSLYNDDDFIINHKITDSLLRQVKDGGTFIFAYNTKLNHTPKNKTWRYHSYSDVEQHFSRYTNKKIFFISRMGAILLRKFAFNPVLTKLNMLMSRVFGVGGDLVCILKK